MENSKLEIVYLPIDSIVPDADNPNRQNDAVFNNLVENIQEIGMVEPIMVCPLVENGEKVPGKYKIVSGEHRWEACKLLDYTEIPAIVKEDFDEDMAKFQMVRMNMLKGKIDPVKFTALYNKMAEKYGEELLKTAMGLVDESVFKSIYIDIKKELPEELQEKLEKAKDDIKTVDDLSRILNELFSKYGDTLDKNFMVFTYSGKTHLWVIMDNELKVIMMEDVVERLKNADDATITEFFKIILGYKEEAFEQLEI